MAGGEGKSHPSSFAPHMDRDGRAFAAACAGAIVVGIAVQVAVLRRGWFYLDDFRNFGDVASGLSWSSLTEPIGVHFSPGHRLLDWFVVSPLGGHHLGAILLIAGLEVLTAGFLLATWQAMVGRHWVQPLLLFLFMTSWPLIGTGEWWAGAALALPAMAASAASMYCFVRSRSGGRGWAAASVLAMAFGLLFSVQVVVVPLLLMTVAFYDRVGDLRRTRLVLALRSTSGHVVVAGSYLGFLHVQSFSPPVLRPSVGTVLSFIWFTAFQGLFPSVLGVGLPYTGLSRADRLWELAALLAVVGAIAVGARRGGRWQQGLAVMVAGVVGTGVLTAVGRSDWGVGIAAEPRYLAIAVFGLWFGLGLALSVPTPARRQAIAGSPATLLVGAVLLVPYLGMLDATTDRLDFSIAQGRAASAYVGNLRAGVGAAEAAGTIDGLVDGEVPTQIWYANDPELNTLSALADGLGIPVPRGEGDELLLVGADGTISPVSFQAIDGPGGATTYVRITVDRPTHVVLAVVTDGGTEPDPTTGVDFDSAGTRVVLARGADAVEIVQPPDDAASVSTTLGHLVPRS